MASASEHIKALNKKVKDLELMISEIGNQVQGTKKRRFGRMTQPLQMNNMTRALCVSTLDPLAQNRVQFYHPTLHAPDTKVKALPWARPISPFGGFDDCGATWVPPAGSTLCMQFENGNRQLPYYMGTMWHHSRGSSGEDFGSNGQFGFPVPEYDDVSKGHRKGFLVGKNDESQVEPPWNNENYNKKTPSSTREFLEDPEEQKRATYSNIYGMKTPEKHMLKFVDGNAKCNRRWKRIELQSGCGNWLIMKDDHLHYGGQWAHPKCGATPGGEDVTLCSEHSGKLPYFTDIHGKPIEREAECEGQSSSSKIQVGHPSTAGNTKYKDSNKGANKYFKNENECRPYKGPGTPQNNRCDLPQSGVQILSIGGHTMVFDDSVEEPRGKPIWERSLESFDFGCSDKCMGRFYLKSMTGHGITASDVEKESGLRGEDNFIEMRSANGSFIQLNDETIGEKGCKTCPPNYAGPKRGVHIGSTSKHKIELIDHMNQQCAPCRKEGGVPINKATKAYVNIESGYGHTFRMGDDGSQEETDAQYIQIMNPQTAGGKDSKANTERGPHILRFQGRPKGEPGVVFLRAGGHSVRSTYDKDIVMVGDKEKNPSDKFTYVSKKHIRSTEDVDFRYSGELHILFAEKQILLMAGRDCSPGGGGKCNGPCLYPVVVGRCPIRCPLTQIVHWTEKSLSERVFASAKQINCATGSVTSPTGSSQPCSEKDPEKPIDTGAGTVDPSGPDTSERGTMLS
jgi:hypothetical protein